MDILIPAVLATVIIGSALGIAIYGSLWLWSLPWHADDEVAE